MNESVRDVHFVEDGNIRSGSHRIKECSIDYKEKIHTDSDFVNHKSYGSGNVTSKDRNYINIIFNNGIKRRFDVFVLKNSGLLIKC